MEKENKSVDFFLGSNSEAGFISHFSQLENPYSGFRSFVIKGGPGTGKSSLMKKIAETFSKKEPLLERIHCSSAPDSLDAVILHTAKASVLDGTPPHVVEPQYPGAFESVVNLLDAFDEDGLEKQRTDIVETSFVISSYHKRFCSILKCANILFRENRDMILPYVDTAKIIQLVNRLTKQELTPKQLGAGQEYVRLVSAFTPDGLLTYQNTINTLCNKIYMINDEYDVCSGIFMDAVRNKVKESGYAFYSCYSPFDPNRKIDHILIPDLGLAFVSTNKYVTLDQVVPDKVINATRFIDREIFRIKKQRLSFNRKTAKELLTEGVFNLKKAKDIHDDLEAYYIPNVDFSMVDQKYAQLEQKIAKRYHN